MENLSCRDGLLVGHSTRRSFQNPRLPSPEGASRASDVDFSDVFGGPPRCASVEVQRSLGEAFSGTNEEGVQPQPARYASPWAAEALGEQPVFGEGSPCRRKHLAVDFFDDIFNGEDSLSSSARQSSEVSRLPSSVPGSFVPSPVHPSLPRQMRQGLRFLKIEYSFFFTWLKVW